MTIAALPDHHRTTDPTCLNLFNRYRHVIAPLRYNAWTTDVEMRGGEYHVRADLGDGTELIIASESSLPIDPNEVTGWSVLRRGIDDPTRHSVLYDSTLDGPQRHHCTSLIPMFARIDKLNVPMSSTPLIVSATHTAPYGAHHQQTAGIETPGAALARFFEWSRRLVAEEGYQQVWERLEPEDGYPLALFESVGHITTIRVTPSND